MRLILITQILSRMSSQDGHPHIQSMSASGCLPKPWRGLAQNPQGHAQSFSLVGQEAQLRSSTLLSGGQRNMTANTEGTSCWSRGGVTQDRAGLVEHSEGQESLQDSSYQEMTFHQQEVLSPGREAAKERNGPLVPQRSHSHTSSSGCSEALADLPGLPALVGLSRVLLVASGWLGPASFAAGQSGSV